MSPKTHCYHTTERGHKIHCDIRGSTGPVLISFHGGGIINGSRRDDHVPQELIDAWKGVWIAADYRLLHPSTGKDIVSDIEALFDYISTLDISLHRIVLAGFSGGAYPLRLAAVLAAKESQKPSPRFTVLGCISFVGMGGDLLLDYWLTPRPLEGDESPLKDQQEQAAAAVKRLSEGEEASDCPYTEGLSGYQPSRGAPWDLWRVAGTINDSITGQDGFSERLRQVEYSKRIDMIPPQFHPLYPQIYFRDNANLIPPFLLIHGEADPMVPHMETLTTKTSLGDSAELISVPFGDHGLQNGGILEKSGEAAIIRMAQWAVERGATQ